MHPTLSRKRTIDDAKSRIFAFQLKYVTKSQQKNTMQQMALYIRQKGQKTTTTITKMKIERIKYSILNLLFAHGISFYLIVQI